MRASLFAAVLIGLVSPAQAIVLTCEHDRKDIKLTVTFDEENLASGAPMTFSGHGRDLVYDISEVSETTVKAILSKNGAAFSEATIERYTGSLTMKPLADDAPAPADPLECRVVEPLF